MSLKESEVEKRGQYLRELRDIQTIYRGIRMGSSTQEEDERDKLNNSSNQLKAYISQNEKKLDDLKFKYSCYLQIKDIQGEIRKDENYIELLDSEIKSLRSSFNIDVELHTIEELMRLQNEIKERISVLKGDLSEHNSAMEAKLADIKAREDALDITSAKIDYIKSRISEIGALYDDVKCIDAEVKV